MYNIKIYNNNYDREDEEDNYESNSRNLRIMHQNSLKSNLSESFLKGERPTKIKIFKCVVWKNLDPNLDEDTIKILLRRSGSHLLKNGGFIMKLPQTKTFKSKQKKFNVLK